MSLLRSHRGRAALAAVAAVLLPSLRLAAAPVTTHPRLWVTQADLPRLRSWASGTNPAYANGLAVALASATATYQTQLFPGGAPNPTFPDGGTSNWEQYPVEAYAEFFAFQSLIDPSPAARIQYAQWARNLVMYAVDRAVLGAAAGQPYRDPAFSTYNRASWWGEGFPLTVDWIHDAVDGSGNPILTAADKSKVRTVFLRWIAECLNAATTGNEHPQPIGVVNSPALLADTEQLRYALNNYYSGHARNVTLMSLALDPADDPGGTLGAYAANATGAWLYQQYALYEKSPAVIAAYGLPAGTPGLGVGSGGLSVEGFEYGASFAYVIEQLLALKTAGYDDHALSGSQVELLRAPVWDGFVAGFLHSITPGAKVFPALNYLGPLHQMMSFGDLLHLYVAEDWTDVFSALTVLDGWLGRSGRQAQSRWILTNAVEGGPAAELTHLSQPWGNAYASKSILHFLALDPAAGTAPDPRPDLPLVFWDGAQGRLLARSNWTANATLFSFRSSWKSINHQLADAGQVELYRKGEWLTKEMSGYSNNGNIGTTPFHNTLSVKNRCTCPSGQPTNIQWYEQATWTSGSQFILGANAGDPVAVESSGPGWAYAQGDMTGLYNRPDPYTPENDAHDVLHASRSAVWLAPDDVLVYDRARTASNGLFKRLTFNFVTQPTVAGNLLTETLPSGQRLFVRALLPAGVGVSAAAIGDPGDNVADLEPSAYRGTIEDASAPTAIRFLTHLEGADGGTPAPAPPVVTSSSGTPFEGAVVGNTAVLFPADLSAPFVSLSYSVPAATRLHLITGLVPFSAYDATLGTSGGTTSVSVVPGTRYRADSGGVLSIPAAGSALSFYAVTPCRVLDTRNASGPFGAPSLDAGTVRDVLVAGRCGVPWDALAVASNVTLASRGGGGYVAAAPPGAPSLGATTSVATPGRNRANNAILGLDGNPPGVTRVVSSLDGPVDVILDVSGYLK